MAQPAIIIMGSTGVGKSDFAVNLAKQCHGVIINSDAFQIYTPLTIGTAKPDLRAVTVPHYLFDVVNTLKEADNWSVSSYVNLLKSTIASLENQVTPIIVGGSAFYIYSLFFPPREIAPQAPLAPSPVHAQYDLNWEYLARVDPTRARSIHPNDRYRLMRAIELFHRTGKPAHEHRPLFDPQIALERIIFLQRPRELLKERIAVRTHDVFDLWAAEVARLGDDWRTWCSEKGIIGYREMIDFVENPTLSFRKTTIDTIIRQTEQYAKRQITFWKKIQRELSQYGLTLEERCLGTPE